MADERSFDLHLIFAPAWQASPLLESFCWRSFFRGDHLGPSAFESP